MREVWSRPGLVGGPDRADPRTVRGGVDGVKGAGGNMRIHADRHAHFCSSAYWRSRSWIPFSSGENIPKFAETFWRDSVDNLFLRGAWVERSRKSRSKDHGIVRKVQLRSGFPQIAQ